MNGRSTADYFHRMSLNAELRSALYVSRCKDCGLQPAQSGARRFDAEVASVQPVPPPPPSELHLPRMRLGARCAQLLARGIVKPTVIDLHGNPGLSDVGGGALLPLLEHGTVRVMDLGACALGPHFCPALARYLVCTPNAGSELVRLELGGASGSLLQRPNHCRGVAVLATVLRKSSPKLSHLGLSHSEIGHTEESEPTAASVASFAVSNGALTSLDVGFNAFGRALWPLLQLLPLVDSLVELDISGNELGDLGVETVSRALCAGTLGGDLVLEHVSTLTGPAGIIADRKLSDGQSRQALRSHRMQLRTLSLDANRITVRGARALALTLATSSSLRVLSLGENPLGDDGVAALASALGPPPPPAPRHQNGAFSSSAAAASRAGGGSDEEGSARNGGDGGEAEMEDATGQAAAQRGPNAKRWDESSEEGSEEEEYDEDAATKAAEDRAAEEEQQEEPQSPGAPPAAAAVAAGGRLDLLNLSACGIGPVGADALCRVVREGRVTALKVARNVLREEGIFALARALRAAQPASVLASLAGGAEEGGGGGGIELLDLSGCRVTDRGALSLIDAACASGGCGANLRTLRLHDNGISDDGGKEMLQRISAATVATTDALANGRQAASGLRNLSVQGNQLSYTTVAALREACAANRHAKAIDAEVVRAVDDLAPSEPALASVQHKLAAERAQMAVVAMQLSTIERALAEVRSENAKASAEEAQAHEEAKREADEFGAQLARLDADDAAEQRTFEAERDTLEAELHALLARRSQLERLDKSTSPGRPRVQLPPGLPLPPALDARLVELLHEGDEREEELAEQAMREKRAYADILWAEEQLSDIRAVVERARLATPAGKKGGKKK